MPSLTLIGFQFQRFGGVEIMIQYSGVGNDCMIRYHKIRTVHDTIV